MQGSLEGDIFKQSYGQKQERSVNESGILNFIDLSQQHCSNFSYTNYKATKVQ